MCRIDTNVIRTATGVCGCQNHYPKSDPEEGFTEFLTKEERIEILEDYLKMLERELKRVKEEIRRLREEQEGGTTRHV